MQHPLEWIEKAQQKGWDVLVDVAAFVPTNRLDLERWKPDFVPLSFYKMFGYPTGLGCLLARKTALAKLHRPWFAGGTITVASVQGDRYYFAEGAPAFEDGTLNYLSIPAIEIGLRHLAKIDIDVIHERVQLPHGLAAGQSRRPAAQQWCQLIPDIRSVGYCAARWHNHDELFTILKGASSIIA